MKISFILLTMNKGCGRDSGSWKMEQEEGQHHFQAGDMLRGFSLQEILNVAEVEAPMAFNMM